MRHKAQQTSHAPQGHRLHPSNTVGHPAAQDAKSHRPAGPRRILRHPGIDECIVVQTVARFEDVSAASADTRVRQTEAGRRLEREIYSNAEFAKCDRQGRLLLPAALLEDLGIGKEVVIAGVNDRIEVWDRVKWEEDRKKSKPDIGKNAEKVFDRPGQA